MQCKTSIPKRVVEHDKYLRVEVNRGIEGADLKKKIGGIRVHVLKGDISECDTAAIVNAANSDLWMGSGVAGAIKRNGGQEIEQEAMAQGPIKPGQAVITNAGRLKTNRVIHCAGMPPGGRATYTNVRDSCIKALQLAEEEALESISFPAIGAGVGRLTIKESVNAILEAIEKHTTSSIETINLVGYGDNSFNELCEALDNWREST
jgi:O-acetyl-ADP-ribose deacetylase (regulator of RNase III)